MLEEDFANHFGSLKVLFSFHIDPLAGSIIYDNPQEYIPTGETPMKKSFKTAYDLPRKVKETIPFRDITNEN